MCSFHSMHVNIWHRRRNGRSSSSLTALAASWRKRLAICQSKRFLALVYRELTVQALILAHEAQEFYGHVLRSTKGMVFLGTPHRGSDLVPWSLLLSNLINAASLGLAVRKELLRNIDRDSEALMEISRQFVHRAAPLRIRSFIEQQIERPLTALVFSSFSDAHGRLRLLMNYL
jgi:hypothetical protein